MKGKKPPEDINVIDRFNESKVLKLKIFKIKKINNVINEYNNVILKPCFIVSDKFSVKKFVNVFLKFSSKISINNIIENKKYNPPIH